MIIILKVEVIYILLYKLKGISSIINYLAGNNSVEYISLNRCNIDNKGAIDIGQGLKLSKSIQRLNLSGNRIKMDGLYTIQQAIKHT